VRKALDGAQAGDAAPKPDVDEAWFTVPAEVGDVRVRSRVTRPEATWRRFWASYLPDQDLRVESTVSPLRATLDELTGLPPALVIVDENDILRDQGEAYASKLRDADVPTACVRFTARCTTS
jgi:acetyl esterase/lipase